MTLPTTQLTSATTTDESLLVVDLRDLVQPLGFKDLTHIRRNFYTFAKRLKQPQIVGFYRTKTYFEPHGAKLVDTIIMTQKLAAAFAVSKSPAVGFELLDALSAPKEPLDSYNSLVFQSTIPFSWLVQASGRTPSSMARTVKLNIERAHGTDLEKHWCWRDSERWFTPWFVANMMVCKSDGMKLKALLTQLVETHRVEIDVTTRLQLAAPCLAP